MNPRGKMNPRGRVRKMNPRGDEQKKPAARRGDEAESSGRKKRRRRDEGESAELAQAKQRLASLRKSLDELPRQREKIEQRIDKRLDSINKAENNLLLKIECSSMRRLLKMHINEVESLRAEKNLLPKPEEILSEIQDLESRIQVISYIDNGIALGPPSSVERLGLVQVQKNDLYDCYFPSRAQPPLPLTLACEVFGNFVDDFKNNDSLVDNKTCKCVVDLFYDVLGRMKNSESENGFQWEFNSRLGEFLGLPVSPYSTECKGMIFFTDATITNGEKWIFLWEYKLEKESTLVQGLQSFLMYVGSLKGKAELLPCFSSCFSLHKDKIASEEVTEAISRALEKGLSITIEGCVVAHGDMRSPNIFVKEAIGGCHDIKFIDFDWAGKVSEATYPPFLNENVKWPPGVEAGKFLRQEHDRWWLTKLKDHDVTASRSSYLRE